MRGCTWGLHRYGVYWVPEDQTLWLFPLFLYFIGITASLITSSTLIYANNCKCFIHLWGDEGDQAAAGLQVRRRRMRSIPSAASLAVPVLGLCRGCAGSGVEDALPSD